MTYPGMPVAEAPAAASAPAKRSGYRYVLLFALLLVYAVSYIDRQIIGILAIPIRAELHLSDSQMGLMGGLAFAIFYTGLALPVARLADRANRPRIIGTALFLWSICTALCGLAGSFGALFLARMGVGVGEAGGVAPAYSLLADYFPPRERGRVIGIYSLGVPIGSAAGLMIGGYVGAHYGWRTAFFALGAAGALLAPLFLLIARETRARASGGAAPQRYDFRATIAFLRHKTVFWLISIATGFGSMMTYGLAFWLPSFAKRSLHLDLTATSQLLGLTALIGGSISMLGSGWLADRLGLRFPKAYALVPCFGCLLTLASVLITLNLHDLTLAFPLLLVVHIFYQSYSSPSIALIQNFTPPPMRATVSAIFLLILNLMGVGLGPTLFGAASDHLAARFGDQGLRFAMMICALIFYSSAAALYAIASRYCVRGEEVD